MSPVAGGSGTAGGSRDAGMRLRLARQARGYSQQQLAGMAGVSRQAVSAVEAGHSDPSLRVALALARALGTGVEELFGPSEPQPEVQARQAAPAGPPGARVTLAPVGDAFVALPLAGPTATRAGFLPAGGVAGPSGPMEASGPSQASRTGGRGAVSGNGGSRGAARPGRAGAAGGVTRPGETDGAADFDGAGGLRAVRPIGPPRPTLVVAGCDPALPLLEMPLALLDPPVSFTWWPCGSREALRLAAAGLVHVAGAHLRGGSGEYNTGPAAERLRRQGAEVIGFCSWREGLVLRPGLAGQVTGLADVARRGLRLVNREDGAEARHVLDRELARLSLDPATLPGYQTAATGHLQVAAAVAAGLADAGVASEPAALAYGLGFVPLAAEHSDLVIPATAAGSREVAGLLRVLSSRWLLDQLASLPGYDPARCGEHVASL
ncbi:MAG TPA: substrate-binding domain-containing protein [Streptosporangiaceae bacterium]|nr:substrate-binding domain-containing protein [Streptosporangiaceae bacterium]